jgi:penicillin amidase
VLRAFGLLLLAGLIIAAATAGWIRWHLGRSLPALTGTSRVSGVSAPVTVVRDARGVPTITGTSQLDVACALGFVHAQERFFQMDLARRRAAGELAELFGRAALVVDRSSRLHRFRARARSVVARATPAERAVLEAYAAGVNAGLGALGAAPFEYFLLRVDPRPWQPEDSVLVVAAMFFTLQDSEGRDERRAALVYQVFPPALAEFLTTTASEWDTPIDGDPLPPPLVPGPEVYDVRQTVVPRVADLNGLQRDRSETAAAPWPWRPAFQDARGSNGWALAGRLTSNGRALLANDIHLTMGVPNTWYRAALAWMAAGQPHRVTGVTLPGVPGVVAGSNGFLAWGFTNSTADWTDLVTIETLPGDASTYRTAEGPRPFTVWRERLAVKGEPDEWLDVRETIWGPVGLPDSLGRPYAIAWVAHDPAALNMRFIEMAETRTLAGALSLASQAGMPAQNLILAHASGGVAWTVAGRIPRRAGFDGRLPVSWADGLRRWNGWYDTADYPAVVDPAGGRIVTANNRLVGGPALARLGDGGYDPGARARQILEGLARIPRATERDMLRVQLDDRAMLMERWRALALDVLDARALDGAPGRHEFRQLVTEGWTGHASVDSVGYRLVREFRGHVAELALAPFVARLRAYDPAFPATPGRALEGPVWALVRERPPHLLDPQYDDWSALLLAAVDRTVARLTLDDRRLRDRTWGESNLTRVQHPLSRAVPALSWWLDMPRQPLPGDSHMPRVQGVTFGASLRFAVSPGREEEGYFHMPAGQSGHPLSPHYRDGHGAWAQGEATPFLPGPPVSRLVLVP